MPIFSFIALSLSLDGVSDLKSGCPLICFDILTRQSHIAFDEPTFSRKLLSFSQTPPKDATQKNLVLPL